MSGARPSVDTRTRSINAAGPTDPATFWPGVWRDALARNGARAATDAARLDLAPVALEVDGEPWTLQRRDGSIEVVPGCADGFACETLDRDAFADLFCERRTALGLVIGARAHGDP
ncbi:MAG TPA: hypothetical protein VN636_15155, partial [Acidimicrobiia bacterium]|nr:hypothetical protein [Acidimicrobiia bacterium]